MSKVVDMILKPILMFPPFFEAPPFTEITCGIVELIKGGELEKIPGIGQILKYGRESVLIVILLIVLFVKFWQYIGPTLWHFVEHYLKVPENNPGDEPSDCTVCGPADWLEFILKKALYGIELLINGIITFLLQVPIDIMSWDMESLSLDFGHLWASESNIFRSGCDRFVNGSYAADFSLYEGETNDSYNSDTHEERFNDVYYNSESNPQKYLCTHGNYCSEMSDVFGKSLMGINSSMTDKSPTNGFVNGINISSAPRKYAVCCGSVPLVDCNASCTEANPLDVTDLQDPGHLFTNIVHVIEHPLNFYDEVMGVFSDLPQRDQQQIECKLKEGAYDWWKGLCKYQGGHIHDGDDFLDQVGGFFEDVGDAIASVAVPCPDTVGFHKPGHNGTPACTESWSEIGRHIREAYRRRKEQCIEVCHDNNNEKLAAKGCQSDYIEKAKRSVMRNRIETINATLPREYTEEGIKDRAIKKTKWRSNERLPELNNNIRYTIPGSSGSMTTPNGTVCTRHDLDDTELENCFGPFRPMTPQQYPVLFYKITKDFMGSILWTLFGLFLFFIILFVLCLFNPEFRLAYNFDKNTGMIEGGMKSMGMNIDKMIK